MASSEKRILCGFLIRDGETQDSQEMIADRLLHDGHCERMIMTMTTRVVISGTGQTLGIGCYTSVLLTCWKQSYPDLM